MATKAIDKPETKISLLDFFQKAVYQPFQREVLEYLQSLPKDVAYTLAANFGVFKYIQDIEKK